jgi:hypothetical protein
MENKDCLTTPPFKECKSKANNLYGFENPVTCTTDIAQLYTLEIIPAPFMGIEIRSHSPVIALTAAASPERALNLLCSPDKRAICSATIKLWTDTIKLRTTTIKCWTDTIKLLEQKADPPNRIWFGGSAFCSSNFLGKLTESHPNGEIIKSHINWYKNPGVTAALNIHSLSAQIFGDGHKLLQQQARVSPFGIDGRQAPTRKHSGRFPTSSLSDRFFRV